MDQGERVAGLERTLTDMVTVIESDLITCDAKLAVVRSAANDALAGKYPPPIGEHREPEPTDTCDKCSAPIIWIRTSPGGKNMPCNPKRQIITTAEGVAVSGFTSHFATCPRKKAA